MSPTAFTPGTRLGSFEIVSLLGVGGMGEVYRATDTNLKRQVAIKVLPPTVATDPDRLARFQREAEVLAALNHPNIAHIHGLEKSDGTIALVMELVEGWTLADRIAKGALPVDEALPIAKQIAEALEAAHEQGIVHRDLKPANIKVRPDGTVKVLDFGLAKLAQPMGGALQTAGDLGQSPTITSPAMMTGAGVILGTAAYMSPEQAKGREADTRSDIWAFGVVVYEMLAGRRAFDGEDMTDVLGAVVRLEPNWEALSSEVPAPVRTLLQGCLVKDRKRRVADISTALFVLDKAASLAAPIATTSTAPLPHRSLRKRGAELTAVALVVAVVAGGAVWLVMRRAEPLPPRLSRLLIAPSGNAALTIDPLARSLAITPDGSRVVYVGNRGTQLFVRALDALEPVVLFTGVPRSPFVSPDNQWVGFVDTGNILKKVAITGGPAITLATLDGAVPRGAIWGPDDTIIFATNNADTGLQTVGSGGGPTTVLTRPDRKQGEADHVWPEWLPGGRAVLFTIMAVTGGLDAAQVAVLDLHTRTHTVLVRGGSHAHYVPDSPHSPSSRNWTGSLTRAGGEGGHLIYASASTLRAVPFDLGRLETRGTAVPVVGDVVTTANGAVYADVGDEGTLAYVPGGMAAPPVTRMVWVDRQGRETPIPTPTLSVFGQPRLSPDGTQIVAFSTSQEVDLWVWNLRRGILTRATFDPGIDAFPLWTPDGRRLIFSSERAGAANIWQSAVDGSAVERLTESPNVQRPSAVSPDGRRLIFFEIAPKTGSDVMQMMLDGTRRVTPLLQSSFDERNGVVSPDGRWLAYEANDSGRFEISVRPFPAVNDGHWQISTSGGTRPVWARSGRELFYVSASGAIMQVGVEHGPSLATTPKLAIKDGYITTPGNPGRSYDVAADGQRFLMVKSDGGQDQTTAPASIIIVLNWVNELKRLAPAK